MIFPEEKRRTISAGRAGTRRALKLAAWTAAFAVITLIGCHLGLGTRGGAEGVGSATTRTVVYSAEMILLLDAYWALTLLRPA